MAPREELIELVEAYAAAKKTDNKLLIGMASKALGAFLKSVDIVKPVDVPEEIKQAVEVQLPKKPAASRRSRSKS
ncbi:hypothetical protein [Synechococcus sp. SYN20]|uniref:hypothetical protein n=1 Tax=Synechococcus sp. SYN20 TaxID=1050714 RepID=UPI001648BD1C|nr:hypothetical protein [Synechococcus sp. SYN20]